MVSAPTGVLERPAAFPRFDCPTCGRSVASVYRDAIHVASDKGRLFHYAYIRPHRTPDGSPCPTDNTGPLARVLA